MNSKKQFFIKGLIIITLLSIIVNQTVWLINMYSLHQNELYTRLNRGMQTAILKEIAERTEGIGGWPVFSTNMNLSNPNDTSRFFVKKVIAEDSTYFFTIDKHDPNTVSKIIQFLLKKELPINLDKLNTIFKDEISPFYKIKCSYFDYFDLKNKSLIETNKPNKRANIHSRYQQTNTIPLDIIESVGVTGYVLVEDNIILKKMGYQLFLSVLLILITFVSLVYISRSFVLQWKTEEMRQESINAMTHEFKRPISGAVALASIIPHYLDKNETNKVIDFTKKIENELNKLSQYTLRIQQISNNNKQNVILEKNPIEIIPFFESLQKNYNTIDDNKEVIINLELNTLRKELYVDILHFSNVMDNLIENAIKYTLNTPVLINIKVTDITNGINISIEDNGIGISAADCKYIFDKYYRVKRKETKNKFGFGLGLTYVKSIIDAHGGNIVVNSKLNQGSEFIITLID